MKKKVRYFDKNDRPVEIEINNFEEAIKKALTEMSEERELWIIEELKPFFDYDEKTGTATFKQQFRIKIQELNDYKQRVKEVIDKLCRLYPNQLSINMGNELKKELGVD